MMCQHCHQRPAYQGKRGLCLPCYRQGHIRKRYPAEVRRPAPRDGNCRHCGKYSPRLRPRGLCWVHFQDRTIREQYSSDSRFAPKGGEYAVTLPLLDCYPNLYALPRCACGRSWDGVCSVCENRQRQQMPVLESEPETADEIVAFVRSLRRPCGGVMC